MRSLFVFFLLSLVPSTARTWTSADGEKTIEGEYVSHADEHVVIKRGTKDIIVKYEFLSDADRKWVEDLDKAVETDPKSSPKDAELLKTLLTIVQHGDGESTVVDKLDQNPHVDATLSKTFLARVGLNGFFKTKATLNGRQFAYYFDWNDQDHLSCITLRSEEFPRADFAKRVKDAWLAGNQLISQCYGEAEQASDFPPVSALTPTANLMITHVWHPEDAEKTLALCVGVDEDKAFVALNYYDRVIKLKKL